MLTIYNHVHTRPDSGPPTIFNILGLKIELELSPSAPNLTRCLFSSPISLFFYSHFLVCFRVWSCTTSVTISLIHPSLHTLFAWFRGLNIRFRSHSPSPIPLYVSRWINLFEPTLPFSCLLDLLSVFLFLCLGFSSLLNYIHTYIPRIYCRIYLCYSIANQIR